MRGILVGCCWPKYRGRFPIESSTTVNDIKGQRETSSVVFVETRSRYRFCNLWVTYKWRVTHYWLLKGSCYPSNILLSVGSQIILLYCMHLVSELFDKIVFWQWTAVVIRIENYGEPGINYFRNWHWQFISRSITFCEVRLVIIIIMENKQMPCVQWNDLISLDICIKYNNNCKW